MESSRGAFSAASACIAAASTTEAAVAACAGLATTLLRRGAFVLPSGEALRLVELEIYLRRSDLHDDPFVHTDARQLSCGGVYFHRSGKGEHAYKGGTYKGLDLTAGDGAGTYVGLLVRAIEAADGSVVDGPCRVVDHLLRRVGASGIAAFVQGLLPALVLPGGAPSAIADTAPLRVALLDPVPAAAGEVFSSARVGLSLKKATPASAHWEYILSPYRLLRRPSEASKGRPHVVCALLRTLSAAEVAGATGVKLATVEKYAESVRQGARRSRRAFAGKVLNTSLVCELHGLLSATAAAAEEGQAAGASAAPRG